jgi:cytidylate kinase
VGYLVAQRLGYPFLDTGVMYRALTWLALQRGIDPEDEEALGMMAAKVDMELGPPPADFSERCSIWVDGQDLTPMLRRPEVEAAVSPVSKASPVRRALVALQRKLAGHRIVMAGRDIGTVVLPNADLKVYLDASVEERTRRRRGEFAAQGRSASEADIQEGILLRDRIDSGREDSPLRPAEDAVIISTDGLDRDQVVEKVLALVEGGS